MCEDERTNILPQNQVSEEMPTKNTDMEHEDDIDAEGVEEIGTMSKWMAVCCGFKKTETRSTCQHCAQAEQRHGKGIISDTSPSFGRSTP